MSYSAALRRTVASLDAAAPVSQIASLGSLLRDSTASERSLSILLSSFALLVAIVGSVGVYSLAASMVAMRTKELGIRMALGASRLRIASLVFNHGLRLACIGAGIGLLTTGIAARLMRSFLYATSPLDPIAIASVVFLLLCVAIIACTGPAWRAARIEPSRALRSE